MSKESVVILATIKRMGILNMILNEAIKTQNMKERRLLLKTFHANLLIISQNIEDLGINGLNKDEE